MKYVLRLPCPGELVRVSRGHYYHYGICVASGKIIHFASPIGDGFDAPEKASVHECSLADFSGDGFTECLELTLRERRYTYPSKKIIENATLAIGEVGYDTLKNNCQHFAFRCIYGNRSGPDVKHRTLIRCLFR